MNPSTDDRSVNRNVLVETIRAGLRTQNVKLFFFLTIATKLKKNSQVE